MAGHTHKRGVVRTLIDNSFLLIAGAVLALLWANGAFNAKGIPESLRLSPQQYLDFINFDVISGWGHEGSSEAVLSEVDALPSPSEAAPQIEAPAKNLSAGAVAATTAAESDSAIGETEHGAHAADGDAEHGGHHGLTLHFIINDIFMALFLRSPPRKFGSRCFPVGP